MTAGADRHYNRRAHAHPSHALGTQRNAAVTPPRTALVVDDDDDLREVISQLLAASGYEVATSVDGRAAIARLETETFDVVVVDMMMPGADGLQVCRAVKGAALHQHTKVVVLTAKSYESDRQAAAKAGADLFLNKPLRVEELLEALDRVIAAQIGLRFFGVRGTLPAPGPWNARYGGNTSCILLELPRHGPVILDAGSGIREAGRFLMSQGSRQRGHILITHPHWDHLNALPFFAPLYVPGNEWRICGPAQPERDMRALVHAQMDGTFFPITPSEFGATLSFVDLDQGRHEVAGLKVAAMYLMHPGRCLGYRFEHAGRSVCYITDNELFLEDDPRHSASYRASLADFVRGARLLVTDVTYFDDEYRTKVGWGHSCVSEVAKLAAAAEVEELCLFHHDPEQDDGDIDRKLDTMGRCLVELGSPVKVLAPAEGDHILV